MQKRKVLKMTDVKLNPLQIDLLNKVLFTNDSYVAVRAGWGSGKTSAIVFSLLAWAESHPNQSSLLITDTANRFRSVLLPEINKWCGSYGWEFIATDSKFITPNGHVIWTRAYFRPGTRDSSHNPLEGLNVTSGLCLIDECQTLDQEVAHKALGRLRSGARPKLVMVGLPVFGAWWVDLAEKANCNPIFYSSYVNEANLSQAWFEATKNLPEDERKAMIDNIPMPREGLVYSEWSSQNVISDFKYDPIMSGRIAIDFGFRKPSVLIIVHDPIRDASVIVKEINPQEVKLEDLSKMILDIAVPRELNNKYPNKILLDGACGDKAGQARNDQTAISNFKLLGKSIDEGGIGINFRWVTDPIRTDIMNGVNRVKRLISQKRILCTKEVWEDGANSKGNSFRKAILGYSWDNKEQPKKTGIEDPLDALRYDVLNWMWRDSSLVPMQTNTQSAPRPLLKTNTIVLKPNNFSIKKTSSTRF